MKVRVKTREELRRTPGVKEDNGMFHAKGNSFVPGMGIWYGKIINVPAKSFDDEVYSLQRTGYIGNTEGYAWDKWMVTEIKEHYFDKLYLTLIDAEDSSADAFFPNYSMFKKVLKRESGEENGIKFEYLDLAR